MAEIVQRPLRKNQWKLNLVECDGLTRSLAIYRWAESRYDYGSVGKSALVTKEIREDIRASTDSQFTKN